MKAHHKILALLSTMLVIESSIAQAQSTILMQRCEEDSLDTTPARARGDWAIKCNYIPANKRILMDTFNDGTADAGRPLYPIFMKPDRSAIWLAPVDVNAPCNRPEEFSKIEYCTASCLTPEQLVLFDDGYTDIKSAAVSLKGGLVTLAEGSTLDHFEFRSQPIDHYTQSLRDIDHLVYVITTRSGGSLRVTQNHPLLRADGQILDAHKLRQGDKLIRLDGATDEITKIKTSTFHGRVYNVAPLSRERVSNLIVAQGFISGSNRYQNWIIDDLNRQVLRVDLDESLFH